MKKMILSILFLCSFFFGSFAGAQDYTDCNDSLVSYFHLNIYLNTVLSDYTDKEYYQLIGGNITSEKAFDVASSISEILKGEVYKDEKTVFSACIYKSEQQYKTTYSEYKVTFEGIDYKINIDYLRESLAQDQLTMIINKELN